MIDLDNQTNLTINLEKLENIANSLSMQEIELIITDNQTIQSLNLEHRGKNSPTDVLSFPLDTSFTQDSIFGMPLGTIIISAEYVIKEAKNFSHSIQEELSLLFIHGVLHLLGYDHEVDQGEMRKREEELIHTFKLPKSLIIRTKEA